MVIYLPLFFGLKIFDPNMLLRTTIAFLIFSLAASAIYIFNDIYDLGEDRQHPKKKNRPIAAGLVSIKQALVLMTILLLTSLSGSYLLDINYFLLIGLYLLINICYSIKLKHIVILDVVLIAIGFVIRIFVVGVLTDVPISMWIVIMTFLTALFIALAKRREDVLINEQIGTKTRKVIDGYNIELLNSTMIIMAAVVIVSYIMYSVSIDVIQKVHTDKLYLTVLFVIIGVMKYLQLTIVENRTGSPTEVLIKNRFIQLVILSWLLSFGLLIYK
jgi:4-hydroxybenzoate polyprenyltransferase